jgi:hypothetical protein
MVHQPQVILCDMVGERERRTNLGRKPGLRLMCVGWWCAAREVAVWPVPVLEQCKEIAVAEESARRLGCGATVGSFLLEEGEAAAMRPGRRA